MIDDGLLSIGAFSLIVGLSVPALRHYDDVGVLKPFTVDPKTSYRYYSPSQVHAARVVRALRGVDLPLDVLRDVVRHDDPQHLHDVLVEHRAEMARRADALAQQLETLDHYIEEGVVVPTTTRSRIAMVNVPVDDLAVARKFYEEALGAEFDEEDHDGKVAKHLQANFGTFGEDNFFLVQIFEYAPQAGTANIGFLVDDLEATYTRALAAGAKSEHPPKDLPGMPRVAQIFDPAGNAIGLYQDVK